jgi:glycosyltransferase involved in cell wall biosynthesis
MRARFALRRLPRWASIATGRPSTNGPQLYYGRDRIPRRDELAHGGIVKFQALAEAWPGSPRDFNIVYLGSSTVPEDVGVLLRLARRRSAIVVWNQNGVAYPGWHGEGWKQTNRPLGQGLHAADRVFFQSEPAAPWEVLHNPVDTARFTPTEAPPKRPTLLLGGNRTQAYRFETALRTLTLLPEEWQLLAVGAVPPGAEEGIAELGLETRVELAGPYSQSEAPGLLRRAHVLLHPTYNDACPTFVLEAMACGLPVVYSASGGTPELVGESGIGLPAPLDWERNHPPAPQELRDAVLEAMQRRDQLAPAARRRTVERFDLRQWLDRHRRLFDELAP